MGSVAFLCFSLLCLVAFVQCFKPMSEHIGDQLSIKKRYISDQSTNVGLANTFAATTFSVYNGPQNGLKEGEIWKSFLVAILLG